MAKRLTFFLADDDPDDRLLLREALESIDPSIKIVEAEDGEQLLAILQTQMVPLDSLIILDINMPKMNGLETLANLRSIPELASVPAVMLSTSLNDDMIGFAKQLGAVNYFVKPSSASDLLALSRKFVLDQLISS